MCVTLTLTLTLTRLRREQVFVVGDLALLEEEGGLGSVFTTLVSARRVRDALRLRSGHQPATVGCPAGGRSRAAEVAVLGTLLGSQPAPAEPETAAGLTHEHVVSYGAQDAVDCSTRPPDSLQAPEWLTEFYATLEVDGGGSERQEPNLLTSPAPDSLDHSQGGMTPRQQALHVARQRIRFSSTDAEIHQVVHTLAVALGAIRTEAGSIKALHAVLVWLERPGTSEEEAYTSTGSSLTSFSRWRRRVQRAQLDLPPRP